MCPDIRTGHRECQLLLYIVEPEITEDLYQISPSFPCSIKLGYLSLFPLSRFSSSTCDSFHKTYSIQTLAIPVRRTVCESLRVDLKH